MTHRILLATSLVLFLTCCTGKSGQTGQSVPEIPYHTDDQFAQSAFDYPLTAKNLTDKFIQFNVKATPTPNTRDALVMDTVYEFLSNHTKFVIYKTQTNDLLQSAHIETNDIEMRRGIKVGISKKEFEEKFGITAEGDLVQVGDEANNSVWTFSFLNDSLFSIDFSGFVE